MILEEEMNRCRMDARGRTETVECAGRGSMNDGWYLARADVLDLRQTRRVSSKQTKVLRGQVELTAKRRREGSRDPGEWLGEVAVEAGRWNREKRAFGWVYREIEKLCWAVGKWEIGRAHV